MKASVQKGFAFLVPNRAIASSPFLRQGCIVGILAVNSADKITQGRHMAYDIYDASVPPLVHMLGSLDHILAKGEAHGGIDPNEARLATRHMLPLKNQVYIATDGAKGCGAAFGRAWDIPKYEDVETSFAELRARGGQNYLLPQKP